MSRTKILLSLSQLLSYFPLIKVFIVLVRTITRYGTNFIAIFYEVETVCCIQKTIALLFSISKFLSFD